MIERASRKNLTPIEIELNQDLSVGEGSEGIDTLETFLAAKSTLNTIIKDMMQGKGESAEASMEYMGLMLVETARSYAHTVQTADNPEEIYQNGAELLQQSLSEIKIIADEYDCGFTIDVDMIEKITEVLETQAGQLGKDEEFTVFEDTYGNFHQDIINVMISHAPTNENDLRRIKQDILKAKALKAAKETAKIALGTTAAFLAVRFFGKK